MMTDRSENHDPRRSGRERHSEAQEEDTPSADEPRVAELPEFSRRLGAPIATVRPVGRPPSQVSGLPTSGGAVEREPQSQEQPRNPADLGHLPPPEGRPPHQPAQPSSPMVRGGGLPVTGAGTGASGAQSASGGGEQQTFYEAVGGHETFQKIVDVFYAQVAEDEEFRALYPEEDLEPAKERLLMFLEQYWGGPRTYQQRRGHPRLRMRHMPFRVDAQARDTWLRYMRRAVDAADLSPMHREILWDYLERAAHSMVNS